MRSYFYQLLKNSYVGGFRLGVFIFFYQQFRLFLRGCYFILLHICLERHFSDDFIFLVLSFVLRMWILILRPNFIRILLGWDGLGVTSYLLVIFYQREKSSNAGIITALTNHLGNVGVISTLLAVVRMRGFVLFIL